MLAVVTIGVAASIQKRTRRERRRVWPLVSSLQQHILQNSAPRPDAIQLLAGMPSDHDLVPPSLREETKEMLLQHLQSLPAAHDPRRLLAGVDNPVIVEVGSFVGEEMAVYSQIASKVIAIEPGPVKVARMRELLAQLVGAGVVNSSTTTILQVAASDRDGEAVLYMPNSPRDGAPAESQQDSLIDSSFWSHSQADKEQAQVAVRTARLDSLLAEPIDLLEIDAQGHDFAVLRGAEQLIQRHGVAIVRVEFWPKGLRMAGEDPLEMLHWLGDRGYACFDSPTLADKTDRVAEPWKLHWQQSRGGSSLGAGPTSFGAYVATLEGMTWVHSSGADVGHWRDLLCFQS